ncbi:MAG: glycerophosphodiester phosphodiesterase [Methanomicrobiales archaeon]|nr:glycerophosphodiester phosphodiesterase [Methanomicrobiales archaeon]
MFVIGHRGAAGCEPENTLRALSKGIECAPFVEVDVRLSRDGVPVIMHDATVDRTTNGIGRVRELDLATLRMFDAGKGEQVPTLEEVLSAAKGRCGLVIELKEPEGNSPVFDLIARTTDTTIWIVSFHDQALKEAKDALPHISRGLIFSRVDPTTIERAITIQAKMIFPEFSLLTPLMVREAHHQHLLVVPWTLNHEREVRMALQRQADGFVTDNPCWGKKVMVSLERA